VIATTPVRELGLAAARADGRPAHVSAASGLVLAGEYLHVVADDENELGVFPRDGGGGRLHALLEGGLPPGKKERKARKADLEILFALPGHGLVAMGSGSRPTRERAVVIALTPRGDATGASRVIDTAPLCALLRREFPELNLEGAALLGDELVLLQRASARDPRNALVFIARADLLRAIDTGVFTAAAPRVAMLDLGRLGGLPWTLTDAAALAGGDLLATAVIEDTRDSYEDGACHGSALARLAPSGELRWLRQLDTQSKVEGIAVTEGARGLDVLLVTDADDAAVPAQLLRAFVAVETD
jgi:hypothetical protein